MHDGRKAALLIFVARFHRKHGRLPSRGHVHWYVNHMWPGLPDREKIVLKRLVMSDV